MNPESHWVKNFALSVLVRFHFASARQHLGCYYNEYPVKQTALLYLKLCR